MTGVIYRRVFTKPVILVYKFSRDYDMLQSRQEINGCELTSDPERLCDAHVVIFHIPMLPDVVNIAKKPGQIWVAASIESDVNYPWLASLQFMQYFDLTMTYRLDSDVPWTYLGPWKIHRLLNPPQAKTAEAPAVYFASNRFEKSGRTGYVRQLMETLPVHSYGRSLKNRTLPEDLGKETKFDTIARYKFTLAFENSISRDYVTEKFFEPLIAGSVPVYRGAPNVRDFAPGEHCFIDATRFSGPRELGEYLSKLARNDSEYESYLHWKTQPLNPRFLQMAEQFGSHPLGRLSAKLSLTNGVALTGPIQRDPIHQAVRWLRVAPRLTACDAGSPG